MANDTLNDAADTMEALLNDNERLRAECDKLRKDLEGMAQVSLADIRKVLDLRAEFHRLRANWMGMAELALRYANERDILRCQIAKMQQAAEDGRGRTMDTEQAKFKIGECVRTQETYEGPRSRAVYGAIDKIRAINGTFQYLINGRWYYEVFTTRVDGRIDGERL